MSDPAAAWRQAVREAQKAYAPAAGESVGWDNSTIPPRLFARLSYNPAAGVEAALRAFLATLEREGCGDLTVSQVLAAARPAVVPAQEV